MAEEPENLVHVYLRRIDGKLDRIAGDVSDPKVRMTDVEERVEHSIAGVNHRIDRIERRLELFDQPH